MRRFSRKAESRRVLRADLVRRVLEQRPRCESCVAAPGVDVHEPHTRGRGGDELDIKGVVVLCRQCHEEAHVNPREAARLGLLLPGGPARKRQLSDDHHAVRALVAEWPGGATVADVLSVYEGAHLLLGELADRGLVEVDAKTLIVRSTGVGARSHFHDYQKDET